jgi:hypothetical protein
MAITPKLAEGLVKTLGRSTNETSEATAEKMLTKGIQAKGLIKRFDEVVQGWIKICGDHVIEVIDNGADGKRRAVNVLYTDLEPTGEMIFSIAQFSVRSHMKKVRTPDGAYPGKISKHALERFTQSMGNGYSLGEVGGFFFCHLNAVVDALAYQGLSTDEIEATYSGDGICIWAFQPDMAEQSKIKVDPVCVTFIKSDRLDRWQRNYDRFREGLRVDKGLPAYLCPFERIKKMM